MEQNNLKISKSIEKLIGVFKPISKEEKGVVVPKIKVSEMVGKVAFVYEKLRNVVDYREEYLLRRAATERIIKRRLFSEHSIKDISKALIQELIRARYLENDKIPETKIKEVAEILDKYILLIQSSSLSKRLPEESEKILDWIMGVAACEIEECLVPPDKEKALIGAIYEIMKKNVVLGNIKYSTEDKELQLYINIHRAFLKSDKATLSYKLLRLYYPDWSKAPEVLIEEIGKHISEIIDTIYKQLVHPLGKRLLPLTKRYAVLFLILKDVLEEYPSEIDNIIANPEKFDEVLREAYKKRYKQAKVILRRSAVRSIIYIFVTKMIIAILLELPVDLILEKSLNYITLGINIIFPPFLMFLVAMFIKLPSKKNINKVVNGIKVLVYENVEIKHKIKSVRQRARILSFIFYLVYILTFGISFGAISYILYKIGFNIVNGLIFVLFLSMVSFFGIRIRQSARELVVSKKEGIINFLFDFFSIPIIRAGKWLSVTLSKINIFVYVMDFIFEAPFKVFIEVFEDWTSFVKEKKEEML